MKDLIYSENTSLISGGNMENKVRYRFSPNDKIFFTSDQHFDHTNIIRFCNRPFKSVEEMNETLIDNWNKKVPEDGIVFILGDFCFGGFPVWESILNRLNGKKYLIKGNHDMKQNIQNEDRLNKMFEWVGFQMLIEVGNRKVYLNHYPFLCYGGSYRVGNGAVYQLFGHVHSGPNNSGLDANRLAYLFPYQYDVGVDNNNYTPISWQEVEEKITNQVNKYENMLFI